MAHKMICHDQSNRCFTPYGFLKVPHPLHPAFTATIGFFLSSFLSWPSQVSAALVRRRAQTQIVCEVRWLKPLLPHVVLWMWGFLLHVHPYFSLRVILPLTWSIRFPSPLNNVLFFNIRKFIMKSLLLFKILW